MLIDITENKDEKLKYLKIISHQFIGNNISPGILDILVESNEVAGRIIADSYNALGNFLLKLYDNNIDFNNFKNNISNKLNLANGDDLKFILQIFEFAGSVSRNTEFTKADAYDGLIKVYKRLINSNVNQEEEDKLLETVQVYKKKRDTINQELNRVILNH